MTKKRKRNAAETLTAFLITALASLADAPAADAAEAYSMSDETQEGRLWGPHNVFRRDVAFAERPGYDNKTGDETDMADPNAQKFGAQFSKRLGDEPQMHLNEQSATSGYSPSEGADVSKMTTEQYNAHKAKQNAAISKNTAEDADKASEKNK